MSTQPITPDAGAVPMQFKDGSQSMVPKEKVTDAMYDGGELLHPMKFPDGSQAMVPHSNLAGAFKDGGQRLDTKPIPAATWKDYVATAFNAATSPTTGAETAIPELGKDVKQGLDEATSGHPVKGAARIGGAVAAATSPAVGMNALGGDVPKAIEQEASELPPASLKSLMTIVKDTAKDADVAAGNLESAGAKKFADVATNGASEARAAGHTAKALAYDTASAVGKVYGKYSAATTWIDKQIPGAPIAFKMWAMAHLAKEGFDFASDKLFGSDDDKEQK